MLDRARRYCAMQEQCETGVRQKLIVWGASQTTIDAVVAQLRSEDYINDVRYARAYSESKILTQHWSRQKVLYQLRNKHLSKEAIEQGLATVSDDDYMAVMTAEAEKKLKALGGELTPDAYRKLMAFLVSRGYTMQEINKVIKNNDTL